MRGVKCEDREQDFQSQWQPGTSNLTRQASFVKGDDNGTCLVGVFKD